MKMGVQFYFIFSVVITCNQAIGRAISPQKYLEKYGYYTESSTSTNVFSMKKPINLSKSLKAFQRFASLNETGIIDNATIKKMNAPRCGVKDIDQNQNNNYNSVLFSNTKLKWAKFDLSYYVENYTKDLDTKSIDRIIEKALAFWGDVSSLKFQKNNDLNSDILIRFVSNYHGDGYDFDGPGKTLAHAFPPPNGDIHFDDDETFTDGKQNGVNLLWVAVHEAGHALGLSHSNVKGSIMYPFYGGFLKNMRLHSDDITRIQSIYGKPGTTPTKTPKKKTTTTTKQRCLDTYQQYLCSSWKRGNYCNTNYRVKAGCQKTCNLC